MSINQISKELKKSVIPTFFAMLLPVILLIGLLSAITGCSTATPVSMEVNSVQTTSTLTINSVSIASGGSLKGHIVNK